MGVLGSPILNVEKLLPDGLGDLADLNSLASVVDRAAVPAQLTHGCHHGRSAAREDLDNVAAARPVLPLFDRDAALLRIKTEFLAQLEDRRAGDAFEDGAGELGGCLLYTSPSPRDGLLSRMPSSA